MIANRCLFVVDLIDLFLVVRIWGKMFDANLCAVDIIIFAVLVFESEYCEHIMDEYSSQILK